MASLTPRNLGLNWSKTFCGSRTRPGIGPSTALFHSSSNAVFLLDCLLDVLSRVEACAGLMRGMWHVAWKTGGNQEFGNGNGNGTGTAMDMPNAATAKLQGQAASLSESPVSPWCGQSRSVGSCRAKEHFRHQRPTLSSQRHVCRCKSTGSNGKVYPTRGPKGLFGSSA